MRPGPDNRWFYIHVMKTGGNTVRRLIERTLDKSNLYPNGSFGDPTVSKVSLQFLASVDPVLLEDIYVFTGHLPACGRELLPYPTRGMTVLREPVARTVSWLRQRQRQHRPDDSLEEIYDDPWRRSFVDDHQTRMLSLRLSDEAESYMKVIDVDSARVAEAKACLDSLELVGLQDDFDRFIATMADRLDLRIKRTAAQNVAPASDVAVSDTLRRRILDDNAADLELYDYARSTRGESL